MRILVTGAAGLTGAEVARRLAAAGHELVSVVRRPEQRDLVVGRAVVADCRDAGTMENLLTSVDALVHVAGIHLAPTLALVPSIAHLGRVVVVSTAGIYSRHQSSAALYRRGEDALRATRPDVLFVRPTMIYGSARDRNVHHVIRFAARFGFLPLFGSGQALLQPIHYEDLAAAVAALVGASPSGHVDAGGGAPVSLRDAALAVFRALGREGRLVRLPLAPALAATGALDAVRGSRWAERLERTTEDRTVSNETLVRLSGIAPRPFSEGVRDQVRSMGLA